MGGQFLFYRDIVPLDRDRHRAMRLAIHPHKYRFAAASHVIPAVIDEFAAAAAHLPIIFVAGQDVPTACFLVGFRSGQNSIVSAGGRWRAAHVPAYLRRYPLMLGEVPDGEPIVCIDSHYVDAAGGEALFTRDGQETDFFLNHMRLLNEYFVSAKRNEVLSRLLVEFDLLRPVTIEVTLDNAERVTVQGFFAVDANLLQALPDGKLLELRRQGFLDAVYAHVHSLASVEHVRKFATGGL